MYDKPQVVRRGLNHVIGFTFISLCCERGRLILTQHLNQWAILLRVQLGRFETFLETRQWSFFHSPPSFHSFSSLTETESALENFFFHTVPVHSNESIVSENIQPRSEDAEGSDSEKVEPGYCAVFLHTLVKCGVSTPPGICQEASIQAPPCVPSGVV